LTVASALLEETETAFHSSELYRLVVEATEDSLSRAIDLFDVPHAVDVTLRGRPAAQSIDEVSAGAVLGKNIWGAWPLIIWETTTAKRYYYKTNYIKHVEKLDLNYPEKILGGLGKIWGKGGGLCPLAPT